MRTDRLSAYAFDSSVIYLNHGAFGAIPRVVTEFQTSVRADVDKNPVRFFHRHFSERFDNARDCLAAAVGTTSNAMVFVSNASEGVSAVLRSIHLEPGDEVLTTSLGYDSVDNAVNEVAAATGATHRKVPVQLPLPSAQIAIDAIAEGVTPKTTLLIIDHVASLSAIVLPVADIVNEVRRRGVAPGLKILVDGAHAPAALDLKVDALGVDYYVGNAHKWLSAGRGTAFVVVDAASRETMRPPTISHGATWNRVGRSRFHDEFDWTGTRDPSAWLSVPCALDFLSTSHPDGLSSIRAEAMSLCQQSLRELSAIGCTPVAPPQLFGCMATVRLGSGADVSPREVADAYFDRYGIETTVFGDEDALFLRASFWLYNEAQDVQALTEATRAIREEFSLFATGSER